MCPRKPSGSVDLKSAGGRGEIWRVSQLARMKSSRKSRQTAGETADPSRCRGAWLIAGRRGRGWEWRAG